MLRAASLRKPATWGQRIAHWRKKKRAFPDEVHFLHHFARSQ